MLATRVVLSSENLGYRDGKGAPSALGCPALFL